MQLGFLDTTTLRPARPSRRGTTVLRSLRNVAACSLGFAVLTGIAFGHGTGGTDPQLYGAGVGAAVGMALWATRGF